MEEFVISYKEVPERFALQCDVCGSKYRYNNGTTEELLEAQEFLRINFVGGYGSIFGDMKRITCDICQNCLMSMIGAYCRSTDAMGEPNADLLL